MIDGYDMIDWHNEPNQPRHLPAILTGAGILLAVVLWRVW